MESARLDPVFWFSSTTGCLLGSFPVGQAFDELIEDPFAPAPLDTSY